MNLMGRRAILIFAFVIILAVLLTGWYIIQTRSPRQEPRDARLVCPMVQEVTSRANTLHGS